MSKNTFSVGYEVYNVNTNETIDCQTMEVVVTDKQLKEMAKVMEDNGGFAPEFSVFQHVYDYLCEECYMDYQENYAPDDDDFWEMHSIDLGDNVPEEMLQAVEKYVKTKEVDVIYYYEENGEERTGNAHVKLPSATYLTIVETAKTKPLEKSDFEHLQDTCPEAFNEVIRLVANDGDAPTHFILKEFPYQVLEQAMASMGQYGQEMSTLKEEIDTILLDGTMSRPIFHLGEILIKSNGGNPTEDNKV